MDHTRVVADFVVNAVYESIPSKALDVAKDAFLDCVGVMLAGSQEESARICARWVREEAAKGEATVVGQGFKSSASLAALANGTASHALDFDHSFSLQGQPTAALIPALLALGEALGATGRDFLTAYVAAFEVTTKLARSIPQHSTHGGWHSTGTLGTIGAAIGAAKLLKLDRAKTQMALGIAASMAGGVVANFATMTKPLHAGLAARNGVVAAGLASGGFTSNLGILERPKGFLHSFSRDLRQDDEQIGSLGRRFELVESGIRIKPYPCGGLAHSAVDALLDLRRRHDIEPAAVENIHVAVTRHTYEAIVYRVPETGLQGKFSLPYLLARVVIQGKLGLEDFSDRAVKDASVRALAEKVHVEHDPNLAEDTEGRRPSVVTVRLGDGRTLSERVDFAKGGREVPLSPSELREKYASCARKAIASDKDIDALADSITHLGDLASLSRISRLLLGPHPS